MMLPHWELVGIMLLCAELLLVLARSVQIQTLAKPEKQRTPAEHLQIKRGMARSLLLEAIVFVPVSVVLVFITVRPVFFLSEQLRIRTATDVNLAIAFHGSLGMTSYGFPFGAIKRLVTRIAMNTLKEFSTIANTDVDGNVKGTEERSTVA